MKFAANLRRLNHDLRFLSVNVVILFVLLNLVAARLPWRADLTRDGLNSVSDSTEKVLSRKGQPILVEAYITRKLPGEIYAEIQPILNQLDEISRIGANRIKLHLIDPQDDDDRKRAERRGVQGIPIEQAKDAEASVRLGYFAVYVQIGEESGLIDLVDQGRIVSDFEYRFLREVKRLQDKEKQSGVGYATLPGSLETRMWQRAEDQSKDNMFGFRSLTERDQGRWIDVSLNEPVPASVETLIVTGLPELDDTEKYYIDQFLMRGGNLLLLLRSFDFQLSRQDPRLLQMGLGSGAGQAFVNQEELGHLNDWLKPYGLQLQGRILFEPKLAAPELDIEGNYLVRMKNPAWAVYSHDSRNFSRDPMFQYTGQLVLPWFSDVVTVDGRQPSVKYRTLVSTSEDVIARESSSLALKDMQRIGSDAADENVGKRLSVLIEAKGSFQSAFANQPKEQLPVSKDQQSDFRPGQKSGSESTIMIMGSPYLVSDIFLRNEQNMQIFQLNSAFVAGLIDELQGDTDLKAARSRIPTIPLLEGPPAFIGYILGDAFEFLFQWFHILALPLLLAAYGWHRLSRRNRKRGISNGGDTTDNTTSATDPSSLKADL